MDAWKLSNIANSYSETKEYRFNNYVVNPHVKSLIGNAKDKALLEVGCGFGRYLEIFQKEHSSKLVGCDISHHQIELCKQYIENDDVVLHLLDFCDSSCPEVLGQSEYDIVYNIFVILYLDTLDQLKMFFANCYKCLKKGGKVLICTLDFSNALFYPEVLSILKLPTRPLYNNQYTDGSPIEISITNDCVVTSYQRDFDTLKSLMTEVGFEKKV